MPAREKKVKATEDSFTDECSLVSSDKHPAEKESLDSSRKGGGEFTQDNIYEIQK